jgi:hypothetical protein
MDGVEGAAVTTNGDGADARLVAYVTPTAAAPASSEERIVSDVFAEVLGISEVPADVPRLTFTRHDW